MRILIVVFSVFLFGSSGFSTEVSSSEFIKLDKNTRDYRKWIKYFSRVRKKGFQRAIKRGQKYKRLISAVFKEYGLPEELYYVGLIESGYRLSATSKASAVGPWQFIEGTGKKYGLKINKSIDERMNIHKATRAAAHYFLDLYNVFGSWKLALAAYNTGEYRVMKSIMKGNTRNFDDLVSKGLLPKETQNYVPKILAAKEILSNHKRYGFYIPITKNIAPREESEYVILKKPMSVKTLAKTFGKTEKEILLLNPEIQKNWLPASSRKSLKLWVPFRPTQKGDRIRTRAARIRIPSFHTVKPGENLSLIANKYHTSVTNLIKINGGGGLIRPGQRVWLRGQSRSPASYQAHRVSKGETLASISRRYRVPIQKIINYNNLATSIIQAESTLKIPK